MTSQKTKALLLRFLVYLATFITLAALVFIVAYILIRGVPHLSGELFEWDYNSDNVSLMPALINTIIMTLCSLVLAVPLGIGAGIYLVEYAGKGNKFVNFVRLTAETLSGIPSIVYGLFGYLFFAATLEWGYSLAAGAFTLAIMILPLIIRTTEEALLGVSDTYREGSFGLGAGRVRTVFRVVLPSAIPGILAGVILGIGRIVGETAALIFTAGTVPELPTALDSSVRTLSVHMYMLSSEGTHIDQTFATAVVLLALVVGLNTIASVVARKLGKGKIDGK